MFLGYDKGFGFNSKPLGGQTRYSLAAMSRTDAKGQQ